MRGLQRGATTNGEEVGKRGKITIQKTGEEKGGAEGYINSNNKRRSLGAEWEMPEVEFTRSHNSDNPQTLVARINNNNMKKRTKKQIRYSVIKK